MATKAELESELAALRAQNAALRSQAEQGADGAGATDKAATSGLAQKLHDVLDEHGIDTANIDALGHQLKDELSRLQRDQPLLALLGAFAIGCVVGRALR